MLEFFILAGSLFGAGITAQIYRGSELGRIRKRAKRVTNRLTGALEAAGDPGSEAQSKLQTVAELYEEALSWEVFDSSPVETLKDHGASGVRWAALKSAGIQSLGDLYRAREWAHQIQGVGTTSLERVNRAIASFNEVRQSEPVRIPTPSSWRVGPARDLVRAAWSVLEARQTATPKLERLHTQAEASKAAWSSIDRRTRFLQWLVGSRSEESLAELRGWVDAEEQRLAELETEGLLDTPQWARVPVPPSDDEVDVAFRSRNADFVAIIEAALGGGTDSAAGGAGAHRIARGLPEEIAARVQAFRLDESGMKAMLRSYQRFGAKYMLVQERTVIGDEMGLGKTVQALAVAAHLEASSPRSHFLVVCPASITLNWLREIERKSRLQPALLHGSNREYELARWMMQGGVAITSFSTLNALELPIHLERENKRVRFLAVDEAHYVKNPDTQRRRAVEALMSYCDYSTYMTGTPLENRLGEFRSIIQLVSEDVSSRVPDQPTAFAKLAERVAPVYLRRNQEDVLTELPERIEKEEWLDLTAADQAAYVQAVESRNYMAMRKAVTIGKADSNSAKVSRVIELIDEYKQMGRKVVIFSFFLGVLDVLEKRLAVVGTIRGGVTPSARTATIDRFQNHPGHATLLSQVEAGGVGINLQAASVVILMEPQWKPSTEVQAIARAHRMGQTEHVIVHRMLARDSVDERIVALLAHKQAIFDASVRDSAVKDASTEATEQGFAKTILDEEYERLVTAA